MKTSILEKLPGDHPWAAHLSYFDSIDSTNTQAKAMAKAGAPHGTVLIADRQTGGRGRLGRSFHSPGGMGIYLSVILRPDRRPEALMHLTCAAGVAACGAVEKALGIRPGIKWTNDIIWGRQKLGGILTELSVDSATGLVSCAVIGIGLNCCQSREELPEELRDMACSLSMALGQPVDRSAVIAALIDSLYQMDAALFTGQQEYMARYRQDCVTLGKEVCLVRFDEVRHATALDVDDSGALVVRLADGSRETVTSGEVSVRGMYGYV